MDHVPEHGPAEGRLRSRPGTPAGPVAPSGEIALGLRAERDSYLFVPSRYRPDVAAPLVLLLHGAGGHARHGLHLLRHLAEASGLILAAPASRGSTWDVIAGGFGADVALIDDVLRLVFARYAVDPGRVSVGGFSDGASYALSLGVTNGDLFSRVIAFSPGFAAPAARRGSPRIFVSHGTGDPVLPIDRCSRRLVPALRGAGYDVLYREFHGGHTIPPAVAEEAVEWLRAPAP